MAAKVDARGLSCPQPALLVRQALQDAPGDEVVVLLDSRTQVDNCTRAAAALGWRAAYVQRAGEFELKLRK